LRTWLRYSRTEAARRGDGLSAECLNLPGPVLRWFFAHHRLWSHRGSGAVARWLYRRSMRGIGQLAWLTGPFDATADHRRAGRLFIRLWLMLTAHGIAVHPFGSVITNPRSHVDFCRMVGEIQGEGGRQAAGGRGSQGEGGRQAAGGRGSQGEEMTWMLFRLGYSAPPPRSHRRPASDLLLSEEVR
jgi:hypothetical protein